MRNSINITVVVPAYNRSETICFCLRSILAQKVLPNEILIVDDCSTDDTVDSIRSFNEPRLRCLIQPRNCGAQAARNRGIREARGEWIAFQDSDDEWLPDKLERQLAALAKVDFNPMTVVHSDCFRQDYQTGQRTLWSLPFVQGDDVFPELLKSSGPMFQGMLVSKKALETIACLDEHVPSYQEWDTAISLSRFCRFIHLRYPLFIYHLHEGETISKNMRRDIAGYQYIIDKFREEILQHCGPAALNRHLSTNARKAMIHGYFQEAEQILKKWVGITSEARLLQRCSRAKSYPGIILSLYDYLRQLCDHNISCTRNLS